MSGLLSVARFRELVPESSIDSGALAGYLSAAQAIAERLTGLVFGAEITAVLSLGSNLYKLTIGSPVGELGEIVRLIGGGVSATAFEIKDAAQGTITVESSVAITTSTTRALPIIEQVDSPLTGEIYCSSRPLFSVVSVETRANANTMWTSAEIKTLDSTQYEVFKGSSRLNAGVRLVEGAIPRVAMGGQFLVKRMAEVAGDCVKLSYAAGFYAAVPADLEMAAVELATAISSSVEEGGAYASENIDYYSYQRLSYDQLAAVPSSAVATFSRYRRY